jgi:hypothetical protein
MSDGLVDGKDASGACRVEKMMREKGIELTDKHGLSIRLSTNRKQSKREFMWLVQLSEEHSVVGGPVYRCGVLLGQAQL